MTIYEALCTDIRFNIALGTRQNLNVINYVTKKWATHQPILGYLFH
jgi:hypothetical protein